MTGPLTPPGFAPTGGCLSFQTAELSRLEGGLLTRHGVALKMLDRVRQIGAVPRSGTLGLNVDASTGRRRVGAGVSDQDGAA